MDTQTCVISRAIQQAGGQAEVARACGVSQPGVFKWTKEGLPRTEWTGETNYSGEIERLQIEKSVDDELVVSRDQLLQRGEQVA